MSKPRSELEIRRVVALLKQQYESLLRTDAQVEGCTACLALLGFGDWMLGEQSDEAGVFEKMIDGMRDVMRRHGERN